LDLYQKRCKPCEGGTPPLTLEESRRLLVQLRDWQLKDGKIEKQFKFKDFVESIGFVNKIADLAESEGHHPDIHISWNLVTLSLVTHAIKGLSENDFILAAKIDRL
jgi:4a-hydroxytetrahydrobiopterin dehydratase